MIKQKDLQSLYEKKVGGGRSNQKNYSDSLNFMTDRCSPARAVQCHCQCDALKNSFFPKDYPFMEEYFASVVSSKTAEEFKALI